MAVKEKLHETKVILIPWTICAALYCGMRFIESMFFGTGTGIYTLYAGLVLLAAACIITFAFPPTSYKSFIICAASQIMFIVVGAYQQELSLYFFLMLILVCVVSLTKNFKVMAQYLIFSIILNFAVLIFLAPRLVWLNHFRFFIQFSVYVYCSLLMLIQTFNVIRKETHAERTLSAFSSLLGKTPNYMLITDSKTRVRYISEPMVKFSHYSRKEFAIGQPLIDLFPDKALKLMFADILDTEGFIETVMTINIEKEERHYKVIADRLGDNDGIFIDISDITPFINAKKNSEEAQSRAEAANAIKSRFLANMSHEIRTPMNAIVGIAQIQLQRADLSADCREAFDKINNSSSNLLGIINDILDMSKIETGKLELSPVEYDIPSLINDTVQLNLVRIGSKPLEFILDINENLPTRLIGDELRLKQILNNLLSNAIKYTNKGFVKLSVNHSADGENVTLRFIVKDSGQGMKREDMEKLFSEYLRFNIDANRSTEGTGLGLNITKALVEMMDGMIAVKSEYGTGSTFAVKVKQKAVPCHPLGSELAAQLRNFKFESSTSKMQEIVRQPMPYGKVLVVDDLETNLYVARGLLEPYELNIETVKSGFAAIDLIKKGHIYDIIFMDHMMPEIDGIETTAKIRELGYKGVIVALTANALAGNEDMFKQKGFNDFISKPIDISHLDLCLNKYIRGPHSDN